MWPCPPSESPKTFFDKKKPIYFAQKCPQNAGNAISETQISKWDFKPIYFAQKCPQNAENVVSETQISKNLRRGNAPGPPYNCVLTMASPSLKSSLRHCRSLFCDPTGVHFNDNEMTTTTLFSLESQCSIHSVGC